MGKAEIFPGAACRPYSQGAAGRIFCLLGIKAWYAGNPPQCPILLDPFGGLCF